uniref:Tumor protein D52 n=1 Tax=Xenopus tropicalis TaxID=8364 RepID=A0A803JUZ8_XENTR
MITQMKEVQSHINSMEVELSIKEKRINSVKREKETIHNNLQSLSETNFREKMVLLEEVTQLKKLAEVSTLDIAHKEEELQKIQHELQRTINNVKEKESEVLHLQAEHQEQIKEHESVEQKLAEKRVEYLRMQSVLHQLEEKYLTAAQSVQSKIGSELRKEAEKLRYQLKEKQMSADEDKYLRTKMAEDCSCLTKENGHLHSQVLEATKQLEKVEEEIQTLSQVLAAKEKHHADIKRKLGVTALSELKQNISKGLHDVASTTVYKRTSETLSHAGQKASAAFSSVGSVITKKLEDVKNSPTYKSFEERVENLKSKVGGNRQSTGDFEEVLNSAANASATEPLTEKDLETQ